uniref:Uncharacterized protein n=1 Tax=Ditylenchus dipsaci TaxID=166011 RepID=A0A915ECY9_9BILA
MFLQKLIYTRVKQLVSQYSSVHGQRSWIASFRVRRAPHATLQPIQNGIFWSHFLCDRKHHRIGYIHHPIHHYQIH